MLRQPDGVTTSAATGGKTQGWAGAGQSQGPSDLSACYFLNWPLAPGVHHHHDYFCTPEILHSPTHFQTLPPPLPDPQDKAQLLASALEARPPQVTSEACPGHAQTFAPAVAQPGMPGLCPTWSFWLIHVHRKLLSGGEMGSDVTFRNMPLGTPVRRAGRGGDLPRGQLHTLAPPTGAPTSSFHWWPWRWNPSPGRMRTRKQGGSRLESQVARLGCHFPRMSPRAWGSKWSKVNPRISIQLATPLILLGQPRMGK